MAVNKVNFGNQTIIDITDTSATPDGVVEGRVFYNAAGVRSTGTLGDATQSTHGLMSATDKTNLDALVGHDHDNDYLSLSGGTVTDSIRIQHNDIDLTEANNGLSSGQAKYFLIKDSNEYTITVFEGGAKPEGDVYAYIGVQNRDENGTATGWRGISIYSDKGGNASYNVSNPSAFRTAIDAVSKTGDTMTGTLIIANPSASSEILARNATTTSVSILAASESHGLYSYGYYNGSSFTSDPKWMIKRDNTGAITVNGTATNVTGVVAIANGGTGKTTDLEAITNLGGIYIKTAGTSITASSNLDTEYKTIGTYYSGDSTRSKTLSGTVPFTGSGFKMITYGGYRAATLRQFAGGASNDLYYRSTQDTGTTWTKWYKFVFLPSGSDNKTFAAIGGATTPVYVDAAGVITAGTALGGAAYKAADYYLPIAGGTLTGHLYFAADKRIYMKYTPSGGSETNYEVLANYNNGNIALNACSGSIYLAYKNTTSVNIFSGKMTINSSGNIATKGTITLDYTGETKASNTIYDALILTYKTSNNAATYTVKPISYMGTSETTNANNAIILMGSSSGATYVHAGEDARVFPSKAQLGNNEELHLVSDGAIYFYATATSTAPYWTKRMYFNTDGLNFNSSVVDLTKANNGVTANANVAGIYFRDKDNQMCGRILSYVLTSTDSAGPQSRLYLQVHHYNGSTGTGYKGIVLELDKDGTMKYDINTPANFRSALGLTSMATATAANYATLQRASDTETQLLGFVGNSTTHHSSQSSYNNHTFTLMTTTTGMFLWDTTSSKQVWSSSRWLEKAGGTTTGEIKRSISTAASAIAISVENTLSSQAHKISLYSGSTGNQGLYDNTNGKWLIYTTPAGAIKTGTITAGTWNGSVIGVSYGGTGSSSSVLKTKSYTYKWSNLAAGSNLNITGTNFGVSAPSGYTPVAIVKYSSGNTQVIGNYFDATATGSSTVLRIRNVGTTTAGSSDQTAAITILYALSGCVT